MNGGSRQPRAPANHVGVKVLAFLVEDGKLRARCGVVAIEGLTAGVVDQCVGHAQRCQSRECRCNVKVVRKWLARLSDISYRN